MNTHKINLVTLSSLIAIFSMVLSLTTWADTPFRNRRVIAEVQRIETDNVITGTSDNIDTLDGVAFPPGANTLLSLKNTGGTLSLFDSQGDPVSIGDIPFFNIAYDGTGEGSKTSGIKSVFIVDNNELINIERKSNGLNADSVTRQTWVPVAGARGMTMDPINNRLFTLQVNDQGVAALVIDQCGSERECSGREAERVTVSLPANVGPKSHGVAFNPENGHIYVLDQNTLHELNLSGTARGRVATLVKSYGLSQLQLGSPINYMTFAKSLDMTDADATFDLFVATDSEVIEFAFPIKPRIGLRQAPPAGVVATLIQTIDVSQFNPPSPDTAGLTYLEDSGTLLAADSEVNETPLFDGVNIFEIDPDPVPGTLVDTFTTFPAFSGEPTGIVYDPNSQHLFISDDNRKEVFETDLNFNLIRQFDTLAFGSNDPEGIAFDPGEGALYIVDGVNKEVYKLTAGSNGIFDGIAPAGDDIVTSFDTCSLGVEDPEGITFQVETGHLLIVGDANPQVCDPFNIHKNKVAEITTDGTLVQTIDISAPDPDSKNSAGLAVASSNSSGVFRIYVAARGLDNGPNPDENDGRIYEFSVQGLVPANTAPQVSAGVDQTIVLPAGVTLDGTVTDDGLPNPPGTVASTWSQVSGPGVTTFADATAVGNTASFSTAGVYVLRLSADDSDLTAFDEVTITVDPIVGINQAPIVDAGLDQEISVANDAILFGTVTDDGLPDPPGAVTSLWSQVSGPGVTSFSDPAMLETTASFSAAGVYVLRLSVNDGSLSATDDVTITVGPVADDQENTIDIRVDRSSDDAEEKPNGSVKLGSSDLEMTFSGSEQIVGMRFNGIVIPNGATITNAYIQFQTDGVTTGPTNLTIEGEAVDNAATFTSSSGNVSGRPRTSSVNWIPAPWSTIGEAGLNQRTSNIALIIQEIVNRQNWASGNSLAVLVSGTGQRDAESFNGNANAGPLLHVEYTTGGVSDQNQAPAVNAGSDQTINVTNSAALSGTVADDGLPNPPGVVTSLWSQVSGPGTVTFGNSSAVSTSASFDLAGTYVLRLTADDGELTNSDELTVTVNSGGSITMLDVRVSASSDDAEEKASTGKVNRGSSDLELADQGRNSQLVGIRFNGLTIPQGATITNAFIQFNADETHSKTTDLQIRAQATDNALTFVSTNGNISSRPLTGTSVEWAPVPWVTVGEEGSNQQTPDISSVVQEIVDRSGWSNGNSLVMIITGSGTRTAESFNGDAATAPSLHIEYQ
jgi:uncharacterized protein YjiK